MDAVQALDIDKTSGLSLRFYQSGSFKAGLQAVTTGGQMVATSAANDFALRSQSNMLFSTGGNTERMRIGSSGTVEVMTSGVNFKAPLIQPTNADVSSYTGTTPSMHSPASATMAFSMGGAERMRIKAGKVSIGTTAVGSATSASLHVADPSVDVQAVFGDNLASIDDPQIRIIGRDTANSAIRYLFTGLDADANHGFIGYNAGAGAFTNALNFNTSGQVGIGTDNPNNSKLHVVSTGSATYAGNSAGTNIALKIQNLESGAAGRTVGIGMFSETNAEVFLNCVTSANNNGGDFVIASRYGGRSEKLRVLGAGGITFNGDTATANALDDYEEGTFQTTWTATTSGGITLQANNDDLHYVKIGRHVTVNGFIKVNTVSSPVGVLSIGLPFTADGTSTYGAAVHLSFNLVGSGIAVNDAWAIISANTNYINVYVGTSTSVSGSFANYVTNSTDLRLTATYITT